MNVLFEIFLFTALLIILTPLLGGYMAKVFNNNYSFLGMIEKWIYSFAGVDRTGEMTAYGYLKALFLFNFIGFIVLFLILIFQNILPFNSQSVDNIPPIQAFNIASSFVTNTNWQSYAGESALSNFSQAFGLTVQNFLSAATGMGILLALIRAIGRKGSEWVGNFWVDVTRGVLYLLLPLSVILAVALISQGAVQTFSPYVSAKTLEGREQIIPVGPVASQAAIKQIGTNGGGYYNTNAAHPFENPNAYSNFLGMLAIMLIPTASTYMYGVMVGSRKHGWLLLFVMFFVWAGGLAISVWSEGLDNPLFHMNVTEGEEARFGIGNSVLWTVSTTDASSGSVNAMIESLSPLTGGIALFNIMLGEQIFGGIGVGLASMIMYAILTVFLSGLMIGRTPEYFGKKIEKNEMRWVVIAVLAPGVLILLGAGLAARIPDALSSISQKGPHGLTEILYAFSSAVGNNGSAFAGLNSNTDFYNLVLGVVMLLGRAFIVFSSLALADLLVKKKASVITIGSFSTETFLFSVLLVGVIFIVGSLAFLPALALGPIVEHILMLRGEVF